MDVSRPYSAVAPTVEGDVLVVLAGTTQPLTGRQVARLARRGSVAGVAKALDRLRRQGLVARLDAPPASLYTLNRQHVAAPVVEALAGLRSEFLRRVRDAFSGWEVQPVHASLFGSAARGDGALDSDVDIFVVRPATVDAEDVTWCAQLAGLSDLVYTSTGNRAGIVDFAEQDIRQMLNEKPPVLDELRRDAIDLAGTPLRELLGGDR
jgi:predicted nucleotidyltransferase